jgi:hypothetical protein
MPVVLCKSNQPTVGVGFTNRGNRDDSSRFILELSMNELIRFMEFHEYVTGDYRTVEKVRERLNMPEVTRQKITEKVQDKKLKRPD